MADERQIVVDTTGAVRAGKEIAFAGQDLADLHRDIGHLIQTLSAGPPWSMDKIGKQVEVGDGGQNKGYRVNEQEVLKAWEQVAKAVEALGVNVQNAIAQVVGADVKSDATVQSVRQPGTNVRRT
ncbi:hypothetical protein Cs7R123_13180 [Catellatospora sp. TT07R-123]|uniref:hypothetical protein n=1 Tax=Catellatospora sp. TT07R-123 TaxID=2733863 RepID=UPI001B185886|nr:hypothetical protein [Catellatospora sp. TT07R-123]GHJ43976.1 hypothetical protein Cs7R123_13180 [Catellatospora sp. TT07R-123]